MFDDSSQKNNLPNPPDNLPAEPVDIFAGVDGGQKGGAVVKTMPKDALSAGRLKQKEAAAPAVKTMPEVDADQQYIEEVSNYDYKMREPILGKIILLILSVAVLAGIGFGAWWIYNNVIIAKKVVEETNLTAPAVKKESDVTTDAQSGVKKQYVLPVATTSAATTTSATTTDISSQVKSDIILFGESIDSDKDGLDDTREEKLGTNINQSDTDSDGLSDGDEVLIWKTDPLKADSDGDGHKDGVEVKNGYNPMGTGKLFSATAGKATTTVSTSK